MLLASCASGVPDGSQPSLPTLTTTSPKTSKPPVTSVSPTSAPNQPPAAGAPISDVIRWVEAGTPADPADFHSATRDGAVTSLGDEVAFVTAGTETNCMTSAGAFACLVKLTNPPPRPPDVETAWKGNWVDFAGPSVDVGSPRGDPGPFGAGTGAELTAGRTLAFGDYRCRADATGLFCVNYAHQSAVQLSAAGVEPFGCLQKAAPPPGVGEKFSC